MSVCWDIYGYLLLFWKSLEFYGCHCCGFNGAFVTNLYTFVICLWLLILDSYDIYCGDWIDVMAGVGSVSGDDFVRRVGLEFVWFMVFGW